MQSYVFIKYELSKGWEKKSSICLIWIDACKYFYLRGFRLYLNEKIQFNYLYFFFWRSYELDILDNYILQLLENIYQNIFSLLLTLDIRIGIIISNIQNKMLSNE